MKDHLIDQQLKNDILYDAYKERGAEEYEAEQKLLKEAEDKARKEGNSVPFAFRGETRIYVL